MPLLAAAGLGGKRSADLIKKAEKAVERAVVGSPAFWAIGGVGGGQQSANTWISPSTVTYTSTTPATSYNAANVVTGSAG